jgi:hypothetical protein
MKNKHGTTTEDDETEKIMYEALPSYAQLIEYLRIQVEKQPD